MTFSISVEFLRGVYVSGSAERREDSEWPPAPARVFCALVAAAADADSGQGAAEALEWLEQQPPPAIIASSADSVEVSLTRESYPPLNKTESASYGRFAARQAGALQRWRHVSPKAPIVRYEWLAVPSEHVAARLAAVADAVPYLGRSTCPVEMSVGLDDADAFVADKATAHEEGVVRWVRGGLRDRVVVGLPRPGYLSALNEAFDEGRRAHEVPRQQLSYGIDEITTVTLTGAHDDGLIVLPFEDRRIACSQVMLATRSMLKALESHLDGGPAILRGGRADQVRPSQQVLLLGLPQVGSEHSSGFIAGFAIALPREIDSAERRAILRAIVAVESNGLVAGPLGRFTFSSQASTLRSLDPRRWTNPSKHWVSATPMSSDRFVDVRGRPTDARAEVLRACAHAGLPTPADVQVSEHPLIDGAENVALHKRRRRPDDRPLPSFHARLTFNEPVIGPVVLGNLRRYGLGLFAPIGAE